MNTPPLLRVALTLSVPVLVGAMHCPRHCPTIGPEFVSRIQVQQQQADRPEPGVRRVQGQLGYPTTVLRQELRISTVHGAVMAKSCTPEIAPWSRAIKPGVIAVPPEVDCLAFSSDLQGWRVEGDLHMFIQEVYGGGRGVGVHGQDCMGLDFLYIEWVGSEDPARGR